MPILECPKCGSETVVLAGKSRHGKQRIKCKDCKLVSSLNINSEDLEIILENVRLAKQKQKLQDTNRIERKSFREHARIENALIEYNEKVLELLKTHSFSKLTVVHNKDSKGAGILQLTDPHFNELVNLKINKYDYEIASRRLKLLVTTAKKIFKCYHVSNILVAMTGDLLNSDRRLDELLNQATNRSKATFLVVDLLKSVFLDLNTCFNVTVACVSGNESRAKDEHSWSNLVITDNYDFTIFNILKYLFVGSSIKFVEGDSSELVVTVGGKNFLLIHGEQKVLLGDVEKGIIQLCGKYSARGIIIDYVLFGHIHYTRIGDHFARGGSLVGANSYSENGLQLITKASQNLHIVTDTRIHSIKVDLQNVDEVEGYNFDKALEAYNPKSADKIKDKVTIFEVVI